MFFGYWPTQPGNPRDWSGLCNCFLSLSICSLYVVTNFLILLQHNIRPPSPNCDMCDAKFVARVNLRRHDTSTQTVNNVIMIFR